MGSRLKMAGKIITKKAYAGSIEEYWAAFLRGDDVDEGLMDTETAMKYSAVNACVRVLSETFASAPMLLYKKVKDGREPVTDLPIYDIFHNVPNDEMSPFNFDETRMMNMCISGNSVCEKLVNKAGETIGLYPYSHQMVNIKRDDVGKLIYEISGKSEKKTLRRDQVLHVPNMSFDGVIGLSPISYAAETIRLGLSYEKYGVNFYRNAAMPSGAFESPNALSEPAYARLKKDLTTNYTGLKNSGVPMLLEEGMKWNQITVNPIDAQLLESKYFQIEDICRIYRVPQHLINKLDRSTFSNIEHLSLEFIMYTMLPIYKREEGAANAQTLTREQRAAGYYFERKIDGLLRGDAASRAEAYATGRQWGWLTVNDILKLENMKPGGPECDIRLQPSNMVEAGSNQAEAVNARLIENIYNLITEKGGKK